MPIIINDGFECSEKRIRRGIVRKKKKKERNFIIKCSMCGKTYDLDKEKGGVKFRHCPSGPFYLFCSCGNRYHSDYGVAPSSSSGEFRGDNWEKLILPIWSWMQK